MTIKLDVYHIQIVAHHFKFKSDFINIIQVRKQFQYLLDRFRINPIPITKETKNLFQYLDTQQFFWKYSYNKTIEKINEKEIELSNTQIQQYNAEISYSQYLKMKEINQKNETTKQMKFKAITYTKEDRLKYGDIIPEEIQVICKNCFKKSEIEQIIISESVTKISDFCFKDCKQLKQIIIPDNVISLGIGAFYKCFFINKCSVINKNYQTTELYFL